VPQGRFRTRDRASRVRIEASPTDSRYSTRIRYRLMDGTLVYSDTNQTTRFYRQARRLEPPVLPRLQLLNRYGSIVPTFNATRIEPRLAVNTTTGFGFPRTRLQPMVLRPIDNDGIVVRLAQNQYRMGTPVPGGQIFMTTISVLLKRTKYDKNGVSRDVFYNRVVSCVVHTKGKAIDRKRVADAVREAVSNHEAGDAPSGEDLMVTKTSITSVDDITNTIAVADQHMRGVALNIPWIDKYNTREIKCEDGMCVPSFLLAELRGRQCRRAGKLTISDIVKGLDEAKGGQDDTGYSANHIESWLRAAKLPVSMHCIGPMGKVHLRSIYPNQREHVCSLVFAVSGGHLHPITRDGNFVKSLVMSGFVKIAHRAEWASTPDETLVLKNAKKLEELCSGTIDSKYKVIALTQGAFTGKYKSIRDVMTACVNASGTAVQLKYTSGSLSGFVHPITGQGITESLDYDLRRKISNHLYDASNYCEDFKFKDTSLSTLANKWYLLKEGSLRKSHFTKQHQHAIKEYSPRAIRYGTTLVSAIHIRDEQRALKIQRLIDKVALCKESVSTSMFKPEYQQLRQEWIASQNELKAYSTEKLAFISEDSVPHAFDIAKAYTHALIDNTWYYPSHAISDNPVRYTGGDLIDCGEYLVRRFTIAKYGITFAPQLMCVGFVMWLFSRDYITKDDLIYEYKASYKHHPDTFKQTTRGLMQRFPKSFKGLINQRIGLLGKKYNTSVESFVSASLETAASAYVTGIAVGKEMTMTHSDGIFIIGDRTKTRLDRDHTAAHRVVIGNGCRMVLEMLEKYYEPGTSVLMGVKTDAIWIHNPKTKAVLPGYRQEYGSPPNETKCDKRPDFDHSLLGPTKWKDIIPSATDSCFISGPAGSGKTTLVGKIGDREAKVLCPTNTAVNNLKSIGFENGTPFHDKLDFRALSKESSIIIDEYSMLPESTLGKVYDNCQNARNVIVGDDNQCLSIGNEIMRHIPACDMRRTGGKHADMSFKEIAEKHPRYTEHCRKEYDGLSKSRSNYYTFCQWAACNQPEFLKVSQTRIIYSKDCQYFKDLCGSNRCVLKFRKGCARSGEKMNDGLNSFLETGKLPLCYLGWNNMTGLKQNLCYTNKKRREIIEKLEPVFKVGMKLMATENIRRKKFSIFNSSFVIIKEIKAGSPSIGVSKMHDNGTVDDEVTWVPSAAFESASAVSCHRYQGKTIHGKYNIYELEKMNKNEAYVALSRAQSWDQPQFDYTDKIFTSPTPTTETWLLPLTPACIGGLYTVKSPCGKKVYFGQVLDYNRGGARFREHVANKKSVIADTWNWEMLSKHVVSDRTGLTYHEQRLIERHDDANGVTCVNKIYRAVIKSKTQAAERKQANLLRDQLELKSEKGRFSIKKNGIRKRFGFSTTGRRGSLTQAEALQRATQFIENEYMVFYQ